MVDAALSTDNLGSRLERSPGEPECVDMFNRRQAPPQERTGDRDAHSVPLALGLDIDKRGVPFGAGEGELLAIKDWIEGRS